MTPTQTGLYGCPSDYPADFMTIDDLTAYVDSHRPDDCRNEWDAINARSAIVTALIELAHDLDARGLVLVDAEEHGFLVAMVAKLNRRLASSPNTGS